MSRPPQPGVGRLVAGLVLIALGTLFLLERFDLLKPWDLARAFADYWPLILVALGLGKVLGGRGRSDRRGGVVLLLIGAWLQVNTLELFDFRWHNSWPLLLIAFGVLLVVDALAGRGPASPDPDVPAREEPP